MTDTINDLAARRAGRARRTRLLGIGLIGVLALAGGALGVLAHVFQAKTGEQTGHGASTSVLGAIGDMAQVALQPTGGFAGQKRVNILCMGIDDNWTDKDEVYTAHARTDTLFLLSLDLDTHKAAMLSIPRDTYTHIPGTATNTKINAAYALGGPECSLEAVNELLGVRADHYLVLNIDATKKMVDALGGVDVDVAHEMHYHDKWGHLSIDLLPGQQHLNGEQAVGFARYRHGDAGAKISPEDGDDRRMARQHVLMRAMIERAKGFANVAQAPHLIDVAMSTIQTDLTRTQLFDLAAIYKGLQPQDLRTASLTGDDFRGPRGEWFYRLDPKVSEAYVRWLIRDDPTAFRPLVPIFVHGPKSDPQTGERAVQILRDAGYAKARLSAALPAGAPTTQVVDQGVVNPDAPSDIKTVLGLTTASLTHEPVHPNRRGWAPSPSVMISLGEDYKAPPETFGELTNTPTQAE